MDYDDIDNIGWLGGQGLGFGSVPSRTIRNKSAKTVINCSKYRGLLGVSACLFDNGSFCHFLALISQGSETAVSRGFLLVLPGFRSEKEAEKNMTLGVFLLLSDKFATVSTALMPVSSGFLHFLTNRDILDIS